MNYLILNSGVSALKYTDRLKALREDRDLTQEKIAKELKVSQITYSQYERGVRGLPTEQRLPCADFIKFQRIIFCVFQKALPIRNKLL